MGSLFISSVGIEWMGDTGVDVMSGKEERASSCEMETPLAKSTRDILDLGRANVLLGCSCSLCCSCFSSTVEDAVSSFKQASSNETFLGRTVRKAEAENEAGGEATNCLR